jgi:hypothetical protein
MTFHQAPRDARGTPDLLEEGSPQMQAEVVSRAKYEKRLQDEAAGKKPSPIERFKRWFSNRF